MSCRRAATCRSDMLICTVIKHYDTVAYKAVNVVSDLGNV